MVTPNKLTTPNRSTRRTVLASLLVHGALSRAALTGHRNALALDLYPNDQTLSSDTFDSAKRWLLEEELAIWQLDAESHHGAFELRLGPAWGYGIGVVVGRRSIACGIGDGRGDLIIDEDEAQAFRSIRVDDIDTSLGAETIASAADLVCELVEHFALPRELIRGVTLAVAAPVTWEGQLASSKILTSLQTGSPPQDQLATALAKRGVEVVVNLANDANVTAIGEWHLLRIAQPRPFSLVALKVSSGIGAAFVGARGRLVRGQLGTAGELGHLPIDVRWLPTADGLPDLQPEAVCRRCGGTAHLESYASAAAVIERVFAEDEETKYMALLERFSSAIGNPKAEGHKTASEAVKDAGRLIGRALAPAAELLGPDFIVVAGELAVAGEDLAAAVGGELNYSGRPLEIVPEIVLSTNEQSAVLGAIRTALEAFPPGMRSGLDDHHLSDLLQDMRGGPESWRVAAPLLGRSKVPATH